MKSAPRQLARMQEKISSSIMQVTAPRYMSAETVCPPGNAVGVAAKKKIQKSQLLVSKMRAL